MAEKGGRKIRPHTMVSAAENGYLIVHRHELDCAEKAHIAINPCFP